jgi:competence protein ComEC
VSPRASVAWRFALIGGLAAGLALAGALEIDPIPQPGYLGLLAVVLIALRPRSPHASCVPFAAAVALIATAAGLAIGGARIEAMDSAALVVSDGTPVTARGVVISPPRAGIDGVRFIVEAPEGRIGVETAALDAGVDEGRVVTAAGNARSLAPWEDSMRRKGVASVVGDADVRPEAERRAGVTGALDVVRRRAEAALERGVSPPAAALLRGFVLGQDDRITADVRDEFRRSGLAHILAVSGQNVMLLALLAAPILALAGVPIRARLLATGAIIAVYVPVAGAGPSIQRAGVMGLAGLVCALSSRPRHRWYALGLAAAITLAIDPRATSDVGWQLSFAAVAGLLLLTQPVVRTLEPEQGFGSHARRALAEGAAMTLAATLATGPLVTHHFGVVSLTAIPANLLALPAVAPAMWLGMLAGALGQIPGAPVEACSWLGGHFAAYIGWVARALGGNWAQLELPEPSLAVAVAWTGALVGLARIACLWIERRAGLRARPRLPVRVVVAGAALAGVLAVAALGPERLPPESGSEPRLVLRFLDVGQGDAILLEPRGRDPLLVDTGPPEADVADRLRQLGVVRLAAVAITHGQRDHDGALQQILTEFRVDRLLVGAAPPALCERLDCPPMTSLTAGDEARVGRLRLRVLWPPPRLEVGDDPNLASLVIRAEIGSFDALLAGDAETGAAGYASGPIDVLKVAHHGSVDDGLASFLPEAAPSLAVISVGQNGYGHPAPETVAVLAAARVPVARTDQAGEVVIEVHGSGWSVE